MGICGSAWPLTPLSVLSRAGEKVLARARGRGEEGGPQSGQGC